MSNHGTQRRRNKSKRVSSRDGVIVRRAGGGVLAHTLPFLQEFNTRLKLVVVLVDVLVIQLKNVVVVGPRMPIASTWMCPATTVTKHAEPDKKWVKPLG